MTSVLVTGANRGIGLGLVRELLNDPSVATVIATVRDIDAAKDLTSIENSRLHVITCEVTDEKSVEAAVEKVAEIVDGKGLDVLINNAGIYRGLLLDGDVSKAVVMEQFEVNAFAPLLVGNKFLGLLKRAAELKGSAQIANISSTLGALEYAMSQSTEKPKTVIYAMSKAALNMLTRRQAFEYKEYKIRSTVFTPGWVQTEMGAADMDSMVEESTGPLAKLILSLTEEHNGEYYRYSGEKLPW
ncbi:hypothetical protein PENTCL1PPCAC_28713 [Pristionchus entomophagus]|uniref:Dehydrogenase n=1 Tax=Pristionchus entomophagus TaxID=358040 RepID=A0AAV5UJI8_9BILA|nr:hypothetical protein PENTCL1PPCAC_28713 [Pristionchus entomophagus]